MSSIPLRLCCKFETLLRALFFRFDPTIEPRHRLAHTLTQNPSLSILLNGTPPNMEDRLHATTAANVAAILSGAHIVRTHDVRPAVEAAAIADRILGVL